MKKTFTPFFFIGLLLFINLRADAQEKGVWQTYTYPDNFHTRDWAATAWTGKELLYWGGSSTERQADEWAGFNADGQYMQGNGFYFTDGWRINPHTGEFRKMAASGLPIIIDGYQSVWTGKQLFVWGNTAGGQGIHKLYDYETDTWKAVSPTGAPYANRMLSDLIWTGEEVFTWGGKNYDGSAQYNDGYLYNPTTNTWRKAAESPLNARDGVSILWTGTEVIVWGGRTFGQTQNTQNRNGAAYNPKTNTWRKIADNPHHEGMAGVEAIWTGTECLYLRSGYYDMGGRIDPRPTSFAYNPTTNTWREVNFVSNPKLTATTNSWTGTKCIVYEGGFDGNGDIWDYKTGQITTFPSRPFAPQTVGTMVWANNGLMILSDKMYFYNPETPYTGFEIKPTFGTFTDPRDGKTYKTVSIKGQTWIAGYLKYKTEKAKCYDKISENCQKMGYLYNLTEVRTAVPDGWRLPTEKDFEKLLDALGGEVFGTKHLFATNSTINEKQGTGKSGLNLELGGYIEYYDRVDAVGSSVKIWLEELNKYCQIYENASFSGEVWEKDKSGKYSYVLCIKK